MLFNYVIVTAMCMRPDSTDVPTIYYWRVNSSSLDGALLLDFITQGPSYEPFTTLTKVEKGCFPNEYYSSMYGFPNSC